MVRSVGSLGTDARRPLQAFRAAPRSSRPFKVPRAAAAGLAILCLCAFEAWGQNPAAPSAPAAQPAWGLPPLLDLSSTQLQPGQPFTVALALPWASGRETIPDGTLTPYRAVLVSADGRRLNGAQFFHVGGFAGPSTGEWHVLTAILAVPNTVKAGTAAVVVETFSPAVQPTAGQTSAGQLSSAQLSAGLAGSYKTLPEDPDRPILQSVSILGRNFIREEIVLDQANTEIRTVPDPIKTAESEELWRILSRVRPIIHDGSAHSLPVDTQRRTSFFGDRRVYVYNNGTQDAGIHAGIDFGVPRGSPVGASAGGRVVLARFRIVTGFTVVVEHLPGVYSSYYHLDSLAVAEGQDIKKGENIGRSGSTGISTGPHLHWELRVATEIADPDVFISQPILDKQDILSRIVRTVEEAKRRTVETDR